jgi:hypothetical protein
MGIFNKALVDGTVPDFNYILPNGCDDGEANCKPVNNRYTQFDNYLAKEIPKIMASPSFGSDGLIIVTYDESERQNGLDPKYGYGQAGTSRCSSSGRRSNPRIPGRIQPLRIAPNARGRLPVERLRRLRERRPGDHADLEDRVRREEAGEWAFFAGKREGSDTSRGKRADHRAEQDGSHVSPSGYLGPPEDEETPGRRMPHREPLRSVKPGGPSVTGGRERRARASPFARLARPLVHLDPRMSRRPDAPPPARRFSPLAR